MDIKLLVLCITFFSIAACDPGNSRPSTTPAGNNTDTNAGTPITTTGTIITPENQIINGDFPGCADAIELVNQTVTIPSLELSFDVDGIIDRIGTVVPSATYTFSIRPVNPLNCDSTTLPALQSPTITLGLNYLADITRNTAICVNASSTVFTQFTITGTPLDSIVEEHAKQTVWNLMDSTIVTRLQPLIGSGVRPNGAAVRCNNWIDIAEL